MMGLHNMMVIASVVLSFALIPPAYAQLADNLMVSGSDKPMAYGVGTYGLKGAGTQGVSGQSEAGGLYSARIPTVTLSRSVPGVMVSDGAGHAKVYNNNLDALGALANIVGSNIDQQIKAHDQEQAAKNVPGNSFLAVQAPQLAPQPSVSSTFYGQPALLTQDSAPGEYSQTLGRRMLQQQAAGGAASSLASMGSQALGNLASKLVGGVADLAQGKGPTITQAADGTLQVLTNNNSGDEVQFQRDGTLTWVNGGNAPGIFSVGPKGVHLEKDNVFNSQAYAAGAPAITIGNDPSAASSSSSSSNTAYAGAVAQAPSASTAYQNSQNTASSSLNAANSGTTAQTPTASTYQNSQNTASSSNSAASSGATAQAPTAGTYQSSQNTQSTYSNTNQAASSSGSGAGIVAPAPVNTGLGAGNSNIYSNAVPTSNSDSQAQAPVPGPDASGVAASTNTGYATAPTAAATSSQSAGVETCCGVASSTPSASPPTQAYNNMQTATYFQAQQPQQQAQDAQGPAAAVENYVTQALGQLQAQQGLPVTQMGAGTGGSTDATSAGRRLLQSAAQ